MHAAQLAEHGCEGVGPIFEDPRGVLAGFSGHIDTMSLTEGLGARYEIERIMMYRLWFGPYLLTSIETLLELMTLHGLQAEDIESITARLPSPVMPLVGYSEYPENGLAAKVNYFRHRIRQQPAAVCSRMQRGWGTDTFDYIIL